jgi:undecaprenyl pyrophosphate phosphatase UppP
LLLFALGQWAIGFYHHLQYRKYKQSTLFGKIHLFAGPFIIIGGIINGFLGFNFSYESKNNIYYGIAVGVILIVVGSLLAWRKISEKKSKGQRLLNVSSEASREQMVPPPYADNINEFELRDR